MLFLFFFGLLLIFGNQQIVGWTFLFIAVICMALDKN